MLLIPTNALNVDKLFVNNDESKDTPKYNDEEVHDRKKEENLKNNICDVSSNEENVSYNYEKLKNKVSNVLVNASSLNYQIDLNESSNHNESGNESKDKLETGTKCFEENSDVNKEEVKVSSSMKKLLDILNFIKPHTSKYNDNELHFKTSEDLQNARHCENLAKGISDSESKEDVPTSNIINFPQTDHKTTRTLNDYRNLIDSESEDEEKERTHSPCTSIDNTVICNTKKISTKKKSSRVSKQEAMRRIHSESQRLCRETSVSLPYHMPKQRTLSEFLNRTKTIPIFAQTLSRAARLKMSSEVVSQALAEKEKEAESFYKSSDSEDDTQQSLSLISKYVERSSVTNEKIASMTGIKHTEESNFDEEKKKSGPEFYKCTLDIAQIPDEQQYRTLKCNFVVSDKNRDNNLTTEIMEISETSNNINNKKMTQVLQRDLVNCVTDVTVTSTNSYDNSITQDENNETKDKHAETNYTSSSHTLVKQISDTLSEIQDNSIIKNCHKSNSHVLGLPLPNFEITTNKKKLLSEFNSKVTLKGSPGMVIDLDDAKSNTKSNTKGANILLNRFFSKHVNIKKQTDNKSEVSVLYLEDTENGPIPMKEVLPYKFPTNTEHNPELDKPGAKLRHLKQSLKLQMNQKRAKEWEQRKETLQTQEEKWSEEEDLDAQEENDLRLSDSGESEPEENDICIKDKKRRTCLFADDEALETDDEGSHINTEDIYDESDTDQMEYGKRFRTERKKEYVDDSETDTCEENYESDKNLDTDIEDVLDMDNDNLNDCEDDNVIRNERNRIRKQLIEFEDDSNSIDSNDLENNQLRSQACKTPSTKTSMLDFVSPITQLSVLNTTLDSNKKDSSEKTEYSIDEHKFVSMENTQNDKSFRHVCDIKNKNIFKRKLFDDTGETVDDEYLMQLCSGKFESTQRTDLDLKNVSSPFNISESQSLELHNENSRMKQDDNKHSESLEVRSESFQDIKLMLDEDFSNSVNQATAIKEVSASSSKRKLRIVSSDDEDEADKYYKPKTRLARRWNLSDSEEEKINSNVRAYFSEEENENDNVENKNDDVESVNDDDEKTEQYIDYDSEENEVAVVPKKNLKNVAADFLEKEAELSESDWDSADEDEKDMDKLEFEEADEEQIDEYEVKNQLEKIHAKQMMDEDKRDIRIMKELLFEDGDLYTDGTGRERKFKWRNIDKLGNMEMSQALDENDGWVDVQEDEDEAQWNKLRQERDKFLEEKMKSSSNEVEDELCSSQIFKRGLEALKKVKHNEPQRQDASPEKKDSSENMEPIMPRNLKDLLNGPNAGKKSQTIYNVIQKRSLLTRGEESLARIASLAKQSDSISHAAYAKKFVFPFIDPQIEDDDAKNENKIREEDRNLKAKKRAITSDFSSAKTKRQRI